MKKFKYLTAAMAAFIVILTAEQSQAFWEQSQVSCLKPSLTEEEKRKIPVTNIDQRVLSLAITKQTNYYRCLRGLKPLMVDLSLTAAAEIHARNMARLNSLSHTVPVSGSRTIADRFKRANVKANGVRAENVGTEYRMAFGTGVFLIQDEKKCRFAYRDTKEQIPVHSYGSLAESSVRNLWDSYSHRRNLLSPKIERVGAAAYFSMSGPAPCGTYYYSQDFSN